jgi:hypothetical protein
MKLHEVMRDGVGVPEDGSRIRRRPVADLRSQTERFTGEFADQANKLVQDPHRPGFEVPAADKV